MDNAMPVINRLLVDVFNDILTIEETALKAGMFNDVTITEVHTVEAVGMYDKQTMGEIARKLNITVGTLTVAVKKLVKKGYVERFRNEEDRRVIKVGLTRKGRLLFRVHRNFHIKMIKECIVGMSAEETEILGSALSKLHEFLIGRYIKLVK